MIDEYLPTDRPLLAWPARRRRGEHLTAHDYQKRFPSLEGCGGTFRIHDARLTATVSEMRPLGKFQLLERVGSGAFGAVWKARDSQLDRIVALKIPHASLVSSIADLERFNREAHE
jgi:serine/threonine protein kinase